MGAEQSRALSVLRVQVPTGRVMGLGQVTELRVPGCPELPAPWKKSPWLSLVKVPAGQASGDTGQCTSCRVRPLPLALHCAEMSAGGSGDQPGRVLGGSLQGAGPASVVAASNLLTAESWLCQSAACCPPLTLEDQGHVQHSRFLLGHRVLASSSPCSPGVPARVRGWGREAHRAMCSSR